jgi:hypothetical protein
MAKIDGGSLEWNVTEFLTLATDVNMEAMKKATIFTQGVAKKMVGGVGSGRTYKRGVNKKFIRTATTTGKLDRRFKQNRARTHRASSPGSPPARDFGILANSISFTVKRRRSIINGFVGSDIDKIRSQSPTSDVEYGLHLEMGTKRMAARPWLRPSLRKATPTINKIFRKANSLL